MVANDPYPPSLQLSSNDSINPTQPTCQSRSLYINLPSPSPNENQSSLPSTSTNEETNVDSTVNPNNTFNTHLGGSTTEGSTCDNQSQSHSLIQQQQQPSGLEVDLPPQTERN